MSDNSSDELVPACPYPDCDSTTITKYVGGMHRATEGEPSHRCRDCGRHFEDPNYRPRRNHNPGVGNLSNAGRAFVETDPENFEIRTHGGTDTDERSRLMTDLGHEDSSGTPASESPSRVIHQITTRLTRAMTYWGLLKHPYGQRYARDRYTKTGGESR